MQQLSSAIFYTQSDIWTAINEIRNLPGNIRVASPYISDKVQFDWKAGDFLLIALSETNVKKGFVNPAAVEELLDKGVKVYSNEKLHAKIYSNYEQAIICSCNLSFASQKEWLEAGVLVADAANLERVNIFFKDHLKETNLVTKERLVELKDLFATDTNEPQELQRHSEFHGNVWSAVLVDGEKLDENINRKIQSSRKEVEVEKNIYTYDHFRSNKTEYNSGDFIIRFRNVNGKMRVYFPASCIMIKSITDELCVVHLRHRSSYPSIEWDNIKSGFADLDLDAETKKLNQGQKVLERLYYYFNK